LNSETAD